MIVPRKVGNIQFDVDIMQANELYFKQDFVSKITVPGISGILETVYENAKISYPIHSTFIELTDCCNFSCPFCYINEKEMLHSSLPRFDKGLKETLDYLIEHGLIYCILSGGECLLHPDFAEIYTYLKEKGVLVTVFTNGYLINDSILSLFKKYKPFKVEISVYGIDDISYRKTTNNAAISSKRVFDNIIKLKESGINVVCKTPITTFTEDIYKEIEKWCEQQKIQYYTGVDMMPSYSGQSRDMYLASKQVRNRMREKSDQEFFHDEELLKISVSTFSKKLNFDCSAGRGDCYISAKNRLMPCMKAYNIPEWIFDINSLGGIRNAYELMADKITSLKKLPLSYCQGCVHSKVCQECFMTQYEFSTDELPSHRKNYCQSLKKFIACGIERE